jgi:hypothetical protein
LESRHQVRSSYYRTQPLLKIRRGIRDCERAIAEQQLELSFIVLPDISG